MKVKGIAIIRLNEKDVVRHRLVRRIIKEYDKLPTDYRKEGK
jgi:phosphate starvation-inducible protein PhoH